MTKLSDFIEEYSAKNVTLKCVSNFPWAYLTSINGKTVRQRRDSDHGYVIAMGDKDGTYWIQMEQEVRDFISAFV